VRDVDSEDPVIAALMLAFLVLAAVAWRGWGRSLRLAKEMLAELKAYDRSISEAESDLAFARAQIATLQRELDAAHLALLTRAIRTTPIGVRRAGSSLVVLLSADDVAFLRRDAYALAQHLCDAVEPETDEQRAHRAILERRLDVQLRVTGDVQ
jgi:hypothetical protein